MASSLSTISRSYLSNGLNSDQIGSSYDYSEALVFLTTSHPTVWSEHYKSKKSASQRLQQFLKRGSQSGPREFWDNITKLFKSIRKSILPTTELDAIELLGAIHSGITRKDEPRANLGVAFNAYSDIAILLSSPLAEEDQLKLLGEMLLPIIPQYLRPNPEQSQWTIPGAQAPGIITKAMVFGIMPSIIEKEWPKYAAALIEDVKTSAPEKSKEYDRSQTALIQQASRLAAVQSQALLNHAPKPSISVFSRASTLIITEALNVLKTRNGKPYGAAGVVAEILRLCDQLVLTNDEAKHQLVSFVQNDIPKLFLSPSCSKLADILYTFKDAPIFEEAWKETLRAVLDASDCPTKSVALEQLLASPRIPSDFKLASSDPEIQNYIKKNVHYALESSSDWEFLSRILQYSSTAIAVGTMEEILASMTQSLSITEYVPNALRGLHQVVKQSPTSLRSFVPTSEGSELIRSLLFLAESPDDQVAQDASGINTLIHGILSQNSDDTASKQSMFDVIQNGLKEASPTSVSVETLVDLSRKILEAGESKSASPEITSYLFPDASAWEDALAPFLDITPKPSIAITNPLGGSTYLVKQSPSRVPFNKSFPRDSEGYSAAFRSAYYVTQIVKETDIFDATSDEMRGEIFRLLLLTVQLADDNLGLAGSNNLWSEYTPEMETDALLFVSDAQSFITEQLREHSARWAEDTEESRTSFLEMVMNQLRNGSQGLSASAYYNARAFSMLVAELVEMHGWNSKKTPEMHATLKGLRKSDGT